MDLRYPVAGLTCLAALSAVRIGAVQQFPTPEITAAAAPEPAIAVQESRDDREQTLRFAPHSLEVAASARLRLTQKDRRFRDDCSGYVSSVFSDAGIPMDGTVAELFALADARGAVHHNPIPRIGDLAFFANTHDRNGNGTWDDANTHIAVVIDVEPDGTAVLAHRGSKRTTLRMNLLHPMTKETDDGAVINQHLRRYGADDTWSLYLASELWTGFATIDPEREWYGKSARARR